MHIFLEKVSITFLKFPKSSMTHKKTHAPSSEVDTQEYHKFNHVLKNPAMF